MEVLRIVGASWPIATVAVAVVTAVMIYLIIRFVGRRVEERSAVKQSTVLTSYAKIGMITYDEGREQLKALAAPDELDRDSERRSVAWE